MCVETASGLRAVPNAVRRGSVWNIMTLRGCSWCHWTKCWKDDELRDSNSQLKHHENDLRAAVCPEGDPIHPELKLLKTTHSTILHLTESQCKVNSQPREVSAVKVRTSTKKETLQVGMGTCRKTLVKLATLRLNSNESSMDTCLSSSIWGMGIGRNTWDKAEPSYCRAATFLEQMFRVSTSFLNFQSFEKLDFASYCQCFHSFMEKIF